MLAQEIITQSIFPVKMQFFSGSGLNSWRQIEKVRPTDRQTKPNTHTSDATRYGYLPASSLQSNLGKRERFLRWWWHGMECKTKKREMRNVPPL